MRVEKAGYLDVVSYATKQDTCLVLPTVSHAIALWPRYLAFITERLDHFTSSRRHLILRDTHTLLMLWVPGRTELLESWRDYIFVSPYGGRTQWH